MIVRKATRASDRARQDQLEHPLVFTRADPEALASFDPRSKICSMNCGPHRDDPRTREERLLLCDECYEARSD